MTTNLSRAALIAAALAAGCTTHENAADNWQDPFFPPRHEIAPTRAILERQYAAGAADDAMLYPIHFDGDQVNSLGEQKLRQMIVGRQAGGVPLHVYVNTITAATPRAAAGGAADATTQPSVDALTLARQSAVEQRLMALGVPASDLIVTAGPNDAMLYASDAGVRAMQPAGSSVGGGTAAPGGTGLPSGIPR